MGFGSAESFETVALYTGLLLGKMAFVSALLAFTRLLTDVSKRAKYHLFRQL